MGHQADGKAARCTREAAEAGDYTWAAAIAVTGAPGLEMQLEQFRLRMQDDEVACTVENWRQPLRALAVARLAALGPGVVDLERVANERLYDLVKKHEVRSS